MTKFKEPTLQSFRGIFVIFIADLIKRIKQNVYILALPFFSDKIRDYIHYFYLGIAVLVLIQLAFSYISYKRYKFRVDQHSFFLSQGIFNTSQIEIPFERIQNINIQQNIVQQILNVVGLEIETAGNDKAEVTIKALDKDDAEDLQEILTQQKIKQDQENTDLKDVFDDKTQASTTQHTNTTKDVLFKLKFIDLVKVGVSSNFLKGIGLIFASLSYIYSSFGDLLSQKFDTDIESQIETYLPSLLSIIVGVILTVVVIGFTITVVLTIVQYFDLKVIKSKGNYIAQYGLFKRVNKLIKAKKTQVFEIETNPIRKLFKFSNVFISQASSEELSAKNKIGIVGVSQSHIQLLFKVLFGISDFESIDFNVIHTQFKRFTVYSLRLLLIFALLVFIQLYFIDLYTGLVIPGLIILFSFFIYLVFCSTKKSYVGTSETLVKVGSGSIHTSTAFVEIFKIQSLAIKQNIYQKKIGLCNLVLYTASGSLKITYLNHAEAQSLANQILFKIESNLSEWM